MLNINFVPDDYIQNNESRRTNLMYLVLFLIVMAAIGGTFATIKITQRSLDAKEKLVNEKMFKAQEAIKQFEELQTKRKVMIKAALTTAELIEPVQKSVLLASLTNNLPMGVSLLRLNLIQKEQKVTNRAPAANSYQAAQAANAAANQPKTPQEKQLDVYIDIEGIAPSDLQVAAYIEQLSNSILLENVALVESKEYEIEDATFRRFKLTSMLRKNIHLTKDDIKHIGDKGQESALNF